MNYNREFITIDTQEKAYILGLIYSDGYVSKSKKTNSYFIGIGLHKNDSYLVDTIRQLFPFLKTVNDKSKPNMSLLRSTNSLFAKDLIELGVLTKKSLINKDRVRFPKIPKGLYKDFIRGIFDGDGSICFNKTNSLNSRRVYFVNNNNVFTRQLKFILFKNGINMKFTEIPLSKPVFINRKLVTFNGPTYTLHCQSKFNIDKLYEFMYTNSTISMVRKKEIFETYTTKIKHVCFHCQSSDNTVIQRKNDLFIYCKSCKKNCYPGKDVQRKETGLPNCINCESTNTCKNGFDRGRKKDKMNQIILCQDCKKTFVLNSSARCDSNITGNRNQPISEDGGNLKLSC